MVPMALLGLCPLSCQVLPTLFISGSIQTTSALAAAHDTKRRGHYTRAVKCALHETAAVALRPPEATAGWLQGVDGNHSHQRGMWGTAARAATRCFARAPVSHTTHHAGYMEEREAIVSIYPVIRSEMNTKGEASDGKPRASPDSAAL